MTRKTKSIQTNDQPVSNAESEGEQPIPFKPRRTRRMARENNHDVKPSESEEVSAPLPSPAKRTSKIAQVIALLERAEGATLAEMVEATGWLPHTTRAALTGLKKKGRTVAKDKRGEVTCYRIEASA